MVQSDRARFETRLAYLLEHSKEHVDGFKDLAREAERLGANAVRDEILRGITHVTRANESFDKALAKLKEGR